MSPRSDLTDLRAWESGTYSQFGEEGVIAGIFDAIGVRHRYCVEFGAKDGEAISNTAHLRKALGWDALLMEGDPKWRGAGVHTEFVTAENVQALFAKYGVPPQFDLLSIDVDGNDYWIWNALSDFVPRVVVVEYNIFFSLDVAKVIRYRPDHVWDGSTYHGASLAALAKLGREKGYCLVHTESWSPNAFFVKRSELPAGYVERPLHELTDWGAYREPRDTADRDWVTV